jgi:Smr domain-containing protein
VQGPSPLGGRVVAVRPVGRDTNDTGWRRLERGPLTVCIVIAHLPVADLPAGARLRIGATAIVELGAPVDASKPGASHRDGERVGVLEAGKGDHVAGEVLEAGHVERGDLVWLEAVTLPLTDVLDLHSFRPEDTSRVVTEYLDGARRAGFGEVRIVHGRGRGVQRAIVRRVLSGAPGVAGFTDAPPMRGGWGATLVRLRRTEDVPSA